MFYLVIIALGALVGQMFVNSDQRKTNEELLSRVDALQDRINELETPQGQRNHQGLKP